MGLSASQARLLSITSRLSDLELSAQKISNQKVRLATQTEELSKNYVKDLNDKDIKLQVGTNSNNPIYKDISYDALTGVNSPLSTQYCVSDNAGRVLVTQDMASKFESSNGDLNTFLSNYEGGGSVATTTTTTYPACGETVYRSKESELAGLVTTLANTPQTITVGALKNAANQNLMRKGLDMEPSEDLLKPYDNSIRSNMLNIKDQAEDDLDWALYNYNDGEYHPDGDSIISRAQIKVAMSEELNNLVATPFSNRIGPTAKGRPAIISVNEWYAPIKEEYEQAAIQYQNDPENAAFLDIQTKYEVASEIYEALAGQFNNDCGTNSELKSANDGYAALADKYLKAYYEKAAVESQYPTSQYPDNMSITNPNYQPAYDAWFEANQEFTGLGEVVTTTNQVFTKGENTSYYTNMFNKMTECGYITMNDEKNTLNNNEWFEEQMSNGNLNLEMYNNKTNKWVGTSISSTTDIIEDYDDDKSAIVKAQYEVDMAKLQRKDKQFDLDLKNIDTEHNALQTEAETVQKVGQKNTERAFKMFS